MVRPLLLILCLVLSSLCASTTFAQCSGGSCSLPSTPIRTLVRQAPVRTFVSRGPVRTRLFPRLFSR